MISKKIPRSLLIALSVTLCLSTTPIAAASVKAPAKAGRTITDPLNTIRSGKGAPVSSLGINGDFYIDITNFNFYGPKANGLWGSPTSMRGPKGVPGVAGVAGAKQQALQRARKVFKVKREQLAKKARPVQQDFKALQAFLVAAEVVHPELQELQACKV